MGIEDLVLGGIGAYFLLNFVVARVALPHLSFRDYKIEEKLPRDMEVVINRINRRYKNDEEFVRAAYDFVTKRYRRDVGERGLLVSCKKAFRKDLNKIWNEKEWQPCHKQNYILRTMLVKSGRFNREDVRLRVTFSQRFMHQYLKVRVKDKWVNVDPAGSWFGVEFGEHLNTAFWIKKWSKIKR